MDDKKPLSEIGMQITHEENVAAIHVLSEYVKAHFYNSDPSFVTIINAPPQETQTTYNTIIDKSRLHIADATSATYPEPNDLNGPWPPTCLPYRLWSKSYRPYIYILDDQPSLEFEEFNILSADEPTTLYTFHDIYVDDKGNRIIRLKFNESANIEYNQQIILEIKLPVNQAL